MSHDTMTLMERFNKEFSLSEQSLNGLTETPFHHLRRQAMDIFTQKGLPTVRHEEWKYTNIFSVLQKPFQKSLPFTATETVLSHYTIPDLDCYRIVLYNGVYVSELSIVENDDCSITTVAHAFHEENNAITSLYATIANNEKNPFVALNTALADNGLVLTVKSGKSIDKPIHIMMINDAQYGAVMTMPRLFISVEKHAKIGCVVTSNTIGDNPSWKNSVIECVVAENASLHIVNCQNDTDNATIIETVEAHVSADAHYAMTTVSLGGNLVRNDANIVMKGKNAETHLYGLILGNGKRLVDNHTIMDHAMPHCESSELYKYILDDKSTGVFNGKVFVREDAQKTNAYQSNRTILLSDTATINTKPQLEIFADDVKCSHGATSGQLDEEQMFYLQARGIGKEKARALLLHAFAGDIIQKIPFTSVADWLDRAISMRLNDNE